MSQLPEPDNKSQKARGSNVDLRLSGKIGVLLAELDQLTKAKAGQDSSKYSPEREAHLLKEIESLSSSHSQSIENESQSQQHRPATDDPSDDFDVVELLRKIEKLQAKKRIAKFSEWLWVGIFFAGAGILYGAWEWQKTIPGGIGEAIAYVIYIVGFFYFLAVIPIRNWVNHQLDYPKFTMEEEHLLAQSEAVLREHRKDIA